MKKKRIGKLGLHSLGYWYARVDGRMVYLTGKGGSKEEAELALAKIRIEMNEGADGTPKTADERSLEEIVTLYLTRMEGTTSPRNLRDKERILQRFYKGVAQRTPMSLTALEIEDFIANFPARSNGAGKRQVFGHLAAMFNWCKAKIDLKCDPMRGVNRPKKHARGEEYVISTDEWGAIRPLLSGTYGDLLETLWWTGARPGEIVGAEIEEFDAKSHTITKKTHKTAHKGKTRVIVLTEQAEEIIRKHIGDRKSGLIFLAEGGGKTCGQWANELLQKAAKKLGRTKPIVAYSLRHSFAVRHLEKGRPINLVAGWLGHSVAVCEQHYAHTLARLHLSRDLLG